MLAVFFALVLLASQNVLHGIPQVMLWSFIGVFGGYFWFLAYAVLDSRQDKPDMIHQLATFHPFWGSSIVPFGKGISFLKKMEAKDETQAAITRINGLRLLLHCVWLRGLRLIFRKVVHGYLGIPIMADAMLQQSLGTPYPTLLCWGSLIASFIEAVLKIAIWGNTVIAITRMAGFNLPPSSNKAFSARTLADFWNRYYFYFKEVLVDFFFYPTFMRCFKKHRRLRIIFATFMAACVGNVIFHFMWEIPMVAKIGLVETLTLFKTYLVYALLLSIGITISQLLPRKPETNSLRNRIFTPLGVCAFFCLIHIFDFDSTRPLQPLSVAFAFLLHLFGF